MRQLRQQGWAVRLSPHAGGVLCSRCKGADAFAIPLGEGAYKLLRLFRRLDMRRLGAITVKPETKDGA